MALCSLPAVMETNSSGGLRPMLRVRSVLSARPASRRRGKSNPAMTFTAVAAVAASRVLGQEMFDVQLRRALALARGSIAEMQTGEGKTLAAIPAQRSNTTLTRVPTNYVLLHLASRRFTATCL
jgi:hypothetical protein